MCCLSKNLKTNVICNSHDIIFVVKNKNRKYILRFLKYLYNVIYSKKNMLNCHERYVKLKEFNTRVNGKLVIKYIVLTWSREYTLIPSL